MTPYQLTDERRPWIRKEERTFSDWYVFSCLQELREVFYTELRTLFYRLKRFHAPLKRYVHFENEPASLQQHFRLLVSFSIFSCILVT